MNFTIQPFTHWREDDWNDEIGHDWLHISFFGEEMAKIAISYNSDVDDVLSFFISTLFQPATKATEDRFLM